MGFLRERATLEPPQWGHFLSEVMNAPFDAVNIPFGPIFLRSWVKYGMTRVISDGNFVGAVPLGERGEICGGVGEERETAGSLASLGMTTRKARAEADSLRE